MQNPRAITMVTRPVTMETSAHARAMCTRPFFLLLKGLGTRLTVNEMTVGLHCTDKNLTNLKMTSPLLSFFKQTAQ